MPGLSGTLDLLAAAFGRSVLRKSLDGYCRLVTAEGEDSLVADDGSLVSVFRLEGFRSLPGEPEISDAAYKLRLALTPYFGSPGYALQFWFGHSPALGLSEINRALSVTSRVARDTGLDIDDLIEERRRLLPQRLTGERAYLAVWSRPSLLTKDERQSSVAKQREGLKGAPSMRLAQWPDYG